MYSRFLVRVISRRLACVAFALAASTGALHATINCGSPPPVNQLGVFFAPNPLTINVAPGGLGSVAVSIQQSSAGAQGWTASATVSWLSINPASGTCSSTNSSCTGTQITASAGSMPAGTYTGFVNISASACGLTNNNVDTLTVTFVVGTPPSIAISAGTASVSLTPGGAAQQVSISLSRTNYTGSVSLSTSAPPTGVTENITQPGTGNSGTITLTAAAGAAAVSNQTITVTASGTGVSNATTTFDVSVTQASSIAISAGTASASLTAGGAAQPVSINLSRTNYTGSVILSTSALPSGVTANITQPGTGNAGTITLTAAAGAAAVSNQTITVTASGTGVSNAMATFSLSVVVSNPVPAIGTLLPASTTAGGASFTLTVTGSNFVLESVVQWNGGSRTTTFINSSQLAAAILASDIAVAGTAQITVFNPAPAGGASNALTFTVFAVMVTPSVSSLSPSSATAGGAGFTLTVTGSNFTAGSVVRWNGSDRATTFVSSSQLSATITAADIASPGAAQVTVNNSAGLSNSVAFTVTAAVCTGTAEPNLSINLDTGFYIAEVRNADGTSPGFWGMSVVTLSGQLVGGFNLGGGVKENGAAPAFGAFYISQPQTVTIDLRVQAVLPGDPTQLSVSVRLLDSNRNQIGTDQFGTSAVLFSRSLAAGFYIVEVRSGGNSPRANFQLSLAAPFFSAGINTGGFLSAGQVGFGAFYVPVPQTAQISVLGASGFGSGAASCLRLRLLDAQRNVIRTVP